jgi:ATP-dependent RNA helicase SUPV3L1/SUV3
VARLGPGKNLLSPRILIDRKLERLSARGREIVVERLKLWVRHQVERVLGPLRAAGLAAQDAKVPAAARSILAMLVDEGGIVARAAVAIPLAALDRDQRRMIARLKVRIGALDLFMPDSLKPEPRRWRTALRVAAAGEAMPALPPESVVLLATPGEGERALLTRLGFRALGPQMLRVDLVERIAARAHEARAGKAQPLIDPALVTSLGLQPAAVARLMKDIGFRPMGNEAGWIWRGRAPQRPQPEAAPGSGAFAALAGLRRG